MPVQGEFRQRVYLDSQTLIFVRDVSIKINSQERIETLDFVIEQDQPTVDSQTAYRNLALDSVIYIEQEVELGDRNDTYSNHFIVVDINEDKVRNYTIKKVKALSFEYLLQNIRFLESWTNINAGDLVRNALNKYLPTHTRLAGFGSSVSDCDIIIEQYDSVFDTLFDLLQYVCKLTGYAWQISGWSDFKYIEFYNPAELHGTEIEVYQPWDIEGSSLRLKTSLTGVFNIAYMIGYQYETGFVEREVAAEECVQELYLADRKFIGWEVSNLNEFIVEGYPENTGQYNAEEGIFRLNAPFFAKEAMTVRVKILFRKPYWVSSFNQDSINKYSALPAPPLSNPGGLNLESAKQILDKFIEEKSYPPVQVAFSARRIGFLKDRSVRLILQNPELDTIFFINSVSHTTRKNELSVEVDLITDNEFRHRTLPAYADPVVDFAKRINRLEKQTLHLTTQAGMAAMQFGPITNLPKLRDVWAHREEIDVEVLTPGVITERWRLRETTDVLVTSSTNNEQADSWKWREQIEIVTPSGEHVLTDSFNWSEQTTVEFAKGNVETQDSWTWREEIEITSGEVTNPDKPYFSNDMFIWDT